MDKILKTGIYSVASYVEAKHDWAHDTVTFSLFGQSLSEWVLLDQPERQLILSLWNNSHLKGWAFNNQPNSVYLTLQGSQFRWPIGIGSADPAESFPAPQVNVIEISKDGSSGRIETIKKSIFYDAKLIDTKPWLFNILGAFYPPRPGFPEGHIGDAHLNYKFLLPLFFDGFKATKGLTGIWVPAAQLHSFLYDPNAPVPPVADDGFTPLSPPEVPANEPMHSQ